MSDWERVPTLEETARLWLERAGEMSHAEMGRLALAVAGALLVAWGMRRALTAPP